MVVLDFPLAAFVTRTRNKLAINFIGYCYLFDTE